MKFPVYFPDAVSRACPDAADPVCPVYRVFPGGADGADGADGAADCIVEAAEADAAAGPDERGSTTPRG